MSAVLGVVALAALLFAACDGRSPASDPATPAALSPMALLSGSGTEGFARALAPRTFVFPDDHGPHPAFRSEWWYFTGIVRAAPNGAGGERRFGYQLTIFRQALAPQAQPRPSAWASRDIYMAHLAVADLDGDARSPRFFADERFARDGLGLGGAGARPLSIWTDAWRISGPPEGGDLFPAHLVAASEHTAIDFQVNRGRGPVLQGQGGLSAKGPQPGNASYYYSCTRLPTRGQLVINGRSFQIDGESWLDREWSTSALEATLAGWDWLGVHLSDGRDLMMYRLRGKDGGTASESRATLIAPDGKTQLFAPGAFTLTATDSWRSPRSGARYPALLRLTIPAASLELTIRPLLADQELPLSVRYWEGAATVSGTADGHALGGSGYLELTGY
jgi:predicted secreted hydrolase